MLQLYSLNGVWLSGSSQLLGARSHPDAVNKIKAKVSLTMVILFNQFLVIMTVYIQIIVHPNSVGSGLDKKNPAQGGAKVQHLL